MCRLCLNGTAWAPDRAHFTVQAFGIKYPMWLERSGNMQFLPTPDGTTLYLPQAEPRSTQISPPPAATRYPRGARQPPGECQL